MNNENKWREMQPKDFNGKPVLLRYVKHDPIIGAIKTLPVLAYYNKSIQNQDGYWEPLNGQNYTWGRDYFNEALTVPE